MPDTAPTVWLQPGVLIIYGATLDAEQHAHHAIQVVLPIDDALCQLEHELFSGAMIINSQVPHQLSMNTGWVLLIEPESHIGQQLKAVIQDTKVTNISAGNTQLSLSKLTERISTNKRPKFDVLLPALLASTGLNLDESCPSDANTVAPKLSDPRIISLLTDLDACLLGQCIKPASWKAIQVAQQLSLSESRFLHLFRQQLGVAWRPFLLWKRLICAIQAMISGRSATEAAYIAGFSDSAHLSRTFRQTFGISIQQARTLLNTN